MGPAEHFGTHQLDGGRTRQEPVLRLPHLTHAALTQPLDELIASEFASPIELRAEVVYHACADVCDKHDEEEWQHEEHEEPEPRNSQCREIHCHYEADPNRNGSCGCQRCRECPAGRGGWGRNNDSETGHPHCNPG